MSIFPFRMPKELKAAGGHDTKVLWISGPGPFKALLRRTWARTILDLWTAIADVLPQFTPAECANYFIACVYEPE